MNNMARCDSPRLSAKSTLTPLPPILPAEPKGGAVSSAGPGAARATPLEQIAQLMEEDLAAKLNTAQTMTVTVLRDLLQYVRCV